MAEDRHDWSLIIARRPLCWPRPLLHIGVVGATLGQMQGHQRRFSGWLLWRLVRQGRAVFFFGMLEFAIDIFQRESLTQQSNRPLGKEMFLSSGVDRPGWHVAIL